MNGVDLNKIGYDFLKMFSQNLVEN